jgi:hypothetical protein
LIFSARGSNNIAVELSCPKKPSAFDRLGFGIRDIFSQRAPPARPNRSLPKLELNFRLTAGIERQILF